MLTAFSIRDLQAPESVEPSEKWPAWRVTTMVVLGCGAFWFGVWELVKAMVTR